MQQPTELDVMKFFTTCQNGLHSRGLSVDETTRFDEAECRAALMGKTKVNPLMAREYHDLSRDDAFWLFLQQDGRDVGCVAARRDSLYSEGLSEFWRRSYQRCYGLKTEHVPHSQAPAVVEEIRGSVVYMGEFYIKPGSRGSRHQLALFTHFLFSYCMMKWRPDWLYGFVRGDDIRKGYAGEYGFSRQVPGAQIWPSPPPGRQNDEYLVAVSRTDLFHMAKFYCSNPEFLLSVDSLTKVEKFST